jgi:hypothetical protein
MLHLQAYIYLLHDSMVLDSAQGHYCYHFIRLALFNVAELLSLTPDLCEQPGRADLGTVHTSIMDSIFRPSCYTLIRITLAEKNEVLYMTILVCIALFRPQCSQKFLWEEKFSGGK